MIKFNYDTTVYNFADKVREYLDFEDLPKIHEVHKFEKRLEQGTDQNQYLHKKFYEEMDAHPEFEEMYVSFIRNIIAPRYADEVIYQKFPTFRVAQPNNVGTFGWHKDADYNHSPMEINYYLPMTRGYDTNTIWHESSPGMEDYKPMNVEYGDIVEWDGANCMHGTKTNETGETRISFDFRVMTLRNYEMYPPKKTITRGTSFEIGEYFERLSTSKKGLAK